VDGLNRAREPSQHRQLGSSIITTWAAGQRYQVERPAEEEHDEGDDPPFVQGEEGGLVGVGQLALVDLGPLLGGDGVGHEGLVLCLVVLITIVVLQSKPSLGPKRREL
jgi:hypothetical protein